MMLRPQTAAEDKVAFVLIPLAFVCSLWAASTEAANYPMCWIRRGECLDQNEGPLLYGVKPQINKNIITARSGIANFDQCVQECLKEDECRFFTYYKHRIPLIEREEQNKTCYLVGFNMGQACFNLEDTCVLLKECLSFDSKCGTCQTGMRPFHDPAEERLTLVMNGVQDDRNYQSEGSDQYDETVTANSELIKDNGDVCEINNGGQIPRFGSTAQFVDDMVVNCGGYSYQEGSGGGYLSTCQKFVNASTPWIDIGDLNTARAYAASVVVPKTSDSSWIMYVIGGYNGSSGFLNSAEKLQSGSWSPETSLDLPDKKSHFCLVMASPDRNGKNFLYAIGGWNVTYFDSVHQIEINENGIGHANGWMEFPSLREKRADLACAEVQIDGYRKGILAAGGYRTDGAWMSSVEFLDYEKGEWTSLIFFPRLHDGRHYHGLTTIGMIPTVFGGWNNGSLSSMEQLDNCKGSGLEWQRSTHQLIEKREKFAYARIPKTFLPNCN